jgi:hypothetical protein
VKRWLQVLIGAFGAGTTQAGILYAAGVQQTIPLLAGSIGTAATTAAGLLKQLPQRKWSSQERKRKCRKEK